MPHYKHNQHILTYSCRLLSALGLCLLLCGLGLGCGTTPLPGGDTPDFCVANAECGVGSECLNSLCVATPTVSQNHFDAGIPPYLCNVGEIRACGDKNADPCKVGTQTCQIPAGGNGAIWGTCKLTKVGSPEVCNGLDDDCDGKTDEGLSRECYSGPEHTQGVKPCKAGTQLCSKGVWGTCAGEITPTKEICDTKDNDCDGTIDNVENAGQLCEVQGKRGPCGQGSWGCRGRVATCLESVQPTKEVCDDGQDNDCDGRTDEDCVCTPGTSQDCYTNTPRSSQGVGECKAGKQACVASDRWGSCVGGVSPQAEVCDGKDNDCDGNTDEGLPQCCKPGATRTCYTGVPSGIGTGVCKRGIQECERGRKWGSCVGEVKPTREECNGKDDDCDGSIDNSPGKTRMERACPGEENRPECQLSSTADLGITCRGECAPAVQVCRGILRWSQTCTNGRSAGKEKCDGKDNDCDGAVDQICGGTHNYATLDPPLVWSARGFGLPSHGSNGSFTMKNTLSTSSCSKQILLLATRNLGLFPTGATYECKGDAFLITPFTTDNKNPPTLTAASKSVPMHIFSPTSGTYGFVKCSAGSCILDWSTGTTPKVTFNSAWLTQGVVKLYSDFCKDSSTLGGMSKRKPFFATLYGSKPGYIQTWTAGNVQSGNTTTGKCEIKTFNERGVPALRSFVFWFPPNNEPWVKMAKTQTNGVVQKYVEIADYNKEFVPYPWLMNRVLGGTSFTHFTAKHAAWGSPSIIVTTPNFTDFSSQVPFLSTFSFVGQSDVRINVYVRETRAVAGGTRRAGHWFHESDFSLLYGKK